MTDLSAIERMTLHEYALRMCAMQLKELDKVKDMHLQAWINRQSKAADKKGKSVYKSFNDFFDAEKEERKIRGIEPAKALQNDSKLIKLISRAND